MSPSIHEWTKSNLRKTAIKNFDGIWSALADLIPSNFLKAVLHEFYLVDFEYFVPYVGSICATGVISKDIL